jgi:HEPN domain-containing protein
VRVKEAKVLLDNGYFSGAYYILGYAVECALKACIAKQIRRYDFPDRRLINDSYTHDLDRLLSVSGLIYELRRERRANSALDVNWGIVEDWKVDSRYETGVSESKARDLFAAVTARRGGVLPWLKRRW